MADNPWLITVAKAAPPTPIWNTAMATISRIMLVTADIIIKIKGLFESPRLLNTPA